MATTDFVVKNGLVVTENAVINETTDASSKDTGALVVEGGVGIEKKLYVGTDLNVGGATTLTGDLAVNGGDLTTSSGTASLFNTTATTVNIAGAATNVQIGAATGTTEINNNLNVVGDVDIDGGDLTASTATFNLLNSTVTTLNVGGAATTVNAGAAGSAGTFTIKNDNTVVDGDLQVKGGDLTTSQATFNLLNTTATTVNFAGAATDVQIGAATGTTEINNNLNVVGDLEIDGGDLTVATTTFNLANTTATTINFGGAATDVQIGAATGTTNVNNNLDVDGDVNIDGGDLTVSTGTFNLANTTATTINFAGAGTSISIGAATGTTTINNANTVVTGDLAVNGADITTTSTGTATVFNANATTLNMGQAATTVSIGATTGTTTVRNSLSVNGNATIGDASSDAVTINSNSVSVPNTLTFTVDDAVTNNVSYPVKLTHTTSGAPANGIGTGIQFITETTANNNEIGATIEAVATDVTATSEDFDLVFKTMAAGATATEGLRITNVGNVILPGDLAVNGGDITTSSTTATVFNATATTVNFAGAGTAVTIGAATGTTTVNHALTVTGVATVNNTAVISANSTNPALRITQVGSGNALLVEDSANPDSTPFAVNSSGQVLNGFLTSQTARNQGLAFSVLKNQVIGSDGNGASSGNFMFNTGSAIAPVIFLAKSSTSTVGEQGALGINFNIGAVSFNASDGTNFIEAASIISAVDGTPGTNDMPGRLVFSTTADGASSPTEAMRIDSGNNVSIGTPTSLARLTVLGPAVGGTLNNTSEIARFSNSNGNVSHLRFWQYRNATGADWTTTSTRIQQRIDATDQGYIEFNPPNATYGLSFGQGGVEFARFLSTGNFGVGTSVAAARFHVRHDQDGPSRILIQNRNATGTPISELGFLSGAFDIADNRYAFIRSAGGSSNYLALGTSNGAVPAEWVRIGANGTISLGGTVGSESLRVTPVASAVNYFNVYGGTAGNAVQLEALGSDANIWINYETKGTGTHQFITDGQGTPATQFRINHTASAVNYMQLTGGATGSWPTFSAAGSDTNVGLLFATKGTGGITFSNSAGAPQFYISPTASAVDYLQVSGSASGFPQIAAAGTSANITPVYSSKGSGGHSFNTNSSTLQFQISNTTSAVNYAQVTGGVTGTGPTISAQGSDTNVNVRLAPKGSGTVQELYNGTYYDIVSQYDIGTNANQIPLNQYLGTLAYQNADNTTIGTLAVTGTTSLGTASANYLSVTGAASGSPVNITTAGSDTNIGLTITTKGTGNIILDTGTSTGDIELKPGAANLKLWDDDSSHYYTFVTGNRTANYNINLPVGDVTLVAGTMITSSGGTFTGQLISTLANSTADGGGQLYLNGATGNRIDFNSNGVAAPAFTTRSVGTKLNLYGGVGAASVDYAIGMESNNMWFSTTTTSTGFKWYGGTTTSATLTGAGALTLTSNLTVSGGTITTGNVAATLLGGNTTTNIALGGGLTSGTFTLGGTATTGTITIDQSNSAHTLNIASGTNATGVTKTINIGTGGASGSTTNITIGSASGGGTITANENITSGVGAAATGLDFATTDSYISARVIRNTAAATYNDGMYIGYANTNSGNTRLFGGGSSTVTMTIGANGTASTSTTTGAVIIAGGVGISGALNATTKSFDIEHPTKSGQRLRHGSLEGPEFGVYVRGRLNGKNIIQLPDYWTGLVDPDSITVNLTPIGSDQGLYVSDIVDNTVIVGGENIHCFYTVFAERKDVDKLVVEE